MLYRLLPAVFLLAAFYPGEGHANPIDCGGNSISFAEVAPPRRAKIQSGPIRVGPDSLCADVIEDRPQAAESIQLTIDPAMREQVSPHPPRPFGQTRQRPPGHARQGPLRP
jgi:hypothetical protein